MYVACSVNRIYCVCAERTVDGVEELLLSVLGEEGGYWYPKNKVREVIMPDVGWMPWRYADTNERLPDCLD